jgi:dipeptidyl aminopeptidase/acylaminoacyl peptidase
MRTIFLILSIFMSNIFFSQQSSNAAITDPEQIRSITKQDTQKYSIEQLMVTRTIDNTTWSPDAKKIAFVSNISGRSNIWLVSTEGGWPVQLTISDQQQAYPAWSPDGKWIAFISDYDGNEVFDLFIVSPLNGKVINLTESPMITEESHAWSPDGKFLAFQARDEKASASEIQIMDLENRKVRKLTSGTPEDFINLNPIWSRDGKWIAFTQYHVSGRDSNIFIIELATGKSTKLTPHSGEFKYEAKSWSPDVSTLLITSNANNGYENVALLDIASSKIEWLTESKWETDAGNFSIDGKTLTWVSNIDGQKDIFLYDLAAKRAQIMELPKGVNTLGGAESAFSPDGSKLLFYHNGPKSPKDVWVYSINESTYHRLTQSLVSGVRNEDLVEPFLIHYPSTDGKWNISAFVYVPYNLQRNSQNPAVVWVHGGPASQSSNWFNPIIQYIVNQGYIVIIPNYRGSTGYSKEFKDANRFDLGGGDLQDVIAATECIKRTGYVDPSKLIIMGGSYGGYMTAMGLTKSPELWAAGVAIIPFFNWFTEFKNEGPQLRKYTVATMGDPVKNRTLWKDRSPIFFVNRIKAPMLILAGGKDPRCPKSESLQMANSLKSRRKIVELKIYENEGHGFSRIENEIDAMKRITDFLFKHIPPDNYGR